MKLSHSPAGVADDREVVGRALGVNTAPARVCAEPPDMNEITKHRPHTPLSESLDYQWMRGTGPESFDVAIQWCPAVADRTGRHEVWRVTVGRLDRETFKRLVAAVGDAVEPFLTISSLAVGQHDLTDAGELGQGGRR